MIATIFFYLIDEIEEDTNAAIEWGQLWSSTCDFIAQYCIVDDYYVNCNKIVCNYPTKNKKKRNE